MAFMDRIQSYLDELRYPQWVKNLIVFLPLFFGGEILNFGKLVDVVPAFIIFSLSASLVYIINDYRDIEEDKAHPVKKNRPLASGKVSKSEAIAISIFLSLFIVILNIILASRDFSLVIGSYIIINLLYSFTLKRVPVVEMLIVSICYLLRLHGGGIVSGIEISDWLYLVIFCGALLFIAGKRLTEIRYTKARSVLKYYREKHIEILVILTAILASVFIAIYAILQGIEYIPQAVIFSSAVIRYVYLLEKTKLGESTAILLDKILILLVLLFSLYTFLIVYIF